MIATVPVGWAETSLGEVVEVLDGEREPVNASEREARLQASTGCKRYPYYGATGQVGWINDFRSEGCRVLLGEDGAPFLDGARNKAYLAQGRFWVNNHAHVLRGMPGVCDDRYLCHQLNAIDYHEHVSGSTRLKLTSSAMRAIRLQLAPYPEQHRIADKLDELLSGNAEAEKELEAAQLRLALHRQSLLKSAVEGALTAEYRQSFAGAETRTPPTSEGRSEGPWPLPATWRWTSLDSLICDGPQNGLYLPADRYGTGVPILRIDDYQVDRVPERSALRQVRADEADAVRYALNSGDLVVNRVNSLTHLGKCIAVPPSLAGALFESNMMRLRLRSGLRPRYVASYLGSAVGRAQLIKNAKWAVNQASINQQDVRNTLVPVPPPDEQVEIERLLDLQLAAVSNQAAAIDKAFAMASAQRQNILRAAFSGQLVPQDPNDEPASVLLERIRAQRQAAAPAAKRKPGRPVKATA